MHNIIILCEFHMHEEKAHSSAKPKVTCSFFKYSYATSSIYIRILLIGSKSYCMKCDLNHITCITIIIHLQEMYFGMERAVVNRMNAVNLDLGRVDGGLVHGSPRILVSTPLSH